MNDCPVERRKIPLSAPSDCSKFHRREHLARPDFRGASVIDEKGGEIPVTETMVQNACNGFIQLWEAMQHKRS